MAKMNDYLYVCVVFMDFKMKFGKMKHRDNGDGFYVKRGLTWHGAMVFYSVRLYVEPGIYEMRQEIMYINHIDVFDDKQDSACSVSLIEAIFNCIKWILPDITRGDTS